MSTTTTRPINDTTTAQFLAPECQRRLKTDPLSILIAEVNLTHPGPLCCSGSAA